MLTHDDNTLPRHAWHTRPAWTMLGASGHGRKLHEILSNVKLTQTEDCGRQGSIPYSYSFWEKLLGIYLPLGNAAVPMKIAVTVCTSPGHRHSDVGLSTLLLPNDG